jgi:hypothetical protein
LSPRSTKQLHAQTLPTGFLNDGKDHVKDTEHHDGKGAKNSNRKDKKDKGANKDHVKDPSLHAGWASTTPA